jgi:hypothetical protein
MAAMAGSGFDFLRLNTLREWTTKLAFFQQLPPALVDKITAAMRPKMLHVNTVLCTEGTPASELCIVMGGSLAMFAHSRRHAESPSPVGRRTVTSFFPRPVAPQPTVGNENDPGEFKAGLYPSDCYGAMALTQPQPVHKVTVVTMEDTLLATISRGEYEVILRDFLRGQGCRPVDAQTIEDIKAGSRGRATPGQRAQRNELVYSVISKWPLFRTLGSEAHVRQRFASLWRLRLVDAGVPVRSAGTALDGESCIIVILSGSASIHKPTDIGAMERLRARETRRRGRQSNADAVDIGALLGPCIGLVGGVMMVGLDDYMSMDQRTDISVCWGHPAESRPALTYACAQDDNPWRGHLMPTSLVTREPCAMLMIGFQRLRKFQDDERVVSEKAANEKVRRAVAGGAGGGWSLSDCAS